MEKIEANGRTVEEAVQAAAAELGVSIEAVDYDIEDHGGKGFLGLGGTPAVIMAWVREGYDATAQPPKPPTPTTTATEESVSVSGEQPVSVTSDDEFAGVLIKTLSDILGAMNVDGKPVLKSADDDEVQIDILGQDVAILIGKHGQTLDALQYLLGIIANRYVPTRRRVVLDAEGYRERHKQALEQKAREYAEAVKTERREAVLDPQNPRDRRIMHVALADDPDVYTYSEGEGDYRHVVISPKK